MEKMEGSSTPESRLSIIRHETTTPLSPERPYPPHKIRVREKMTTELKTGSKSWWWTARRLAGKGGKSEIQY